MSEWPIFKTTNPYHKMSVFEKLELFKLVTQYWVYQNIIDPTDTLKNCPTHIGKTYSVINNIIFFLSVNAWGKKWKMNIDLNECKKEFKLYISDTKVTIKADPNIEHFRTHFGNITSIADLSILKKKDMYKKIITYWINLKQITYNITELKDEINKLISSSINDYNKMTINMFISNFNKYIAGVSIDEDPDAVKLRNTNGFIFPKSYFVEKSTGKRSRIEEINDYDEYNDEVIEEEYYDADDDDDDKTEVESESFWLNVAAGPKPDANINTIILNKCSNCHKSGHNKRTCEK
jgi:hypothetical protein